MANPLDKIKGLNYKEFALEHGEKAGLGLIVVIALLMIMAGQWKTESRTPEELTSKVSAASTKLDQTAWPEEKQTTYTNGYHEAAGKYTLKYDMRKKTFDEIQATSHNLRVPEGREYSTRMSWPLYKQQEKVKEPVYLPVMQPIADYGRVIIEVAENTSVDGDPLSADGLPGEKKTEEGDTELDPEFQRRKDRTPNGIPGGGGVGENGLPTGGYVPDYSAPGAGNENDDNDALDPNYSPNYNAVGDGGEGTDPSDLYSGTASNVNGRGERFVSVRAVFPMKDQLKKFAEALGVDLEDLSPAEQQQVEIIDFHMERQTAVGGDNPWSGEWKPVDLDVVKKIMTETSDFDVDELDSGVIDPVISMPLPRRILGLWDKHASHPLLKNFELSPEELEAKNKIDALLLQMQQKANGGIKPVRKGGFSGFQYDTNEARQQLLGGSNSNDYYAQLQNELAGTGPDAESNAAETSKLLTSVKQRVGQAAVGHLILFRYLDFDVTPGNAYRYRVKLVLRNPFFGQKREYLAHPDIAENQVEETDWSEPTPPVVIPKDTQYFLTKVEEPRSATQEPSAKMNVFYWYPEVGTTVNKEISVAEGQFIGGKTRAEVLNHAKETFEEEEVQIASTDLLLDIKEEPDLDPSEHPDLEVNTKKIGARDLKEGLIDQALAVDEYGELTSLDPFSNWNQKQALQARQKKIAEIFSDYKEKLEEAGDGDALEGGYPGGYPNYSADGTSPDGEPSSGLKPRKGRSATRRRGGGFGGGPSYGPGG